MVIIGNYSKKLRFSDAKSPKRATPHSFLLPLFLKLKFPPLPLFRSEILPKIAPLGRKLSDFVSISAVFLPFFAIISFFVSFFTDFIPFSPFCLLLFPNLYGCVHRLSIWFYIYAPISAASQSLYSILPCFHPYRTPFRLSICVPFFINLMLNYTKNTVFDWFLSQNCYFFAFLSVFCCFSRIFLFHVKLFLQQSPRSEGSAWRLTIILYKIAFDNREVLSPPSPFLCFLLLGFLRFLTLFNVFFAHFYCFFLFFLVFAYFFICFTWNIIIKSSFNYFIPIF